LMIEYEKQEEISSIHINWESAIAKKYQVLLSNDGKKWDTVFI